MEFDRVRNDEQRKIRIQQIKDGATKLFDTMQYHEITLALIANETAFTRGNLYKYITSKEEIFMLVILDEVRDWIKDLEDNINDNMSGDIKGFSETWANITFRHIRLLKLMTLLFAILERNVPLDRLVKFKDDWFIETSKCFNIVRKAFPKWDAKTLRMFLDAAKNYAIGLFPMTSPSQIQREAVEASTMVYEFPDFVKDYSRFLEIHTTALNDLS